MHVAGHGPYAARAQVGTFLVIEESASFPRLAAESLVAAGLLLMRASTVDQAVGLLGSVELDGLIICVGTRSDEDDPLRPGFDILVQLPAGHFRSLTLVLRDALTPDERRVALRHDAEIIRATSLRHVSARDHLIEQLSRHLRP